MSQTSNVDYLFETYSTSEIQDIQRKLRNDIEKRKQDVKELVNERYRDLIEAADSIQQMKQNCLEAIESVSRLESTRPIAKPLIVNLPHNPESEQETQIQLVKDSPLMIWKLLEKYKFYDAVRLLWLCSNLCNSLLESVQSDLLKKTKPIIMRMKSKILKACWNFLVNPGSEYSKKAESLICISLLLRETNEIVVKKYLITFQEEAKHELKFASSLPQALCGFFEMTFEMLRTFYSVYLSSGNSSSLFHVVLRELQNAKPLREIHNLSALNIKPVEIDWTIVLKSMVTKEFIVLELNQFVGALQQNFVLALDERLNQVEDLEGITTALTKLSEYFKSLSYPTWDALCDMLMGKKFPVWETFLQEKVMARIKELFSMQLAFAFHQINVEKCLMIDPVALDHFLWNSPSSDDSLRSKSFGLNDSVSGALSPFHAELDKIDHQRQQLALIDNCIFNPSDLEGLKDHVSRRTSTLIKALEEQLRKNVKEEVQSTRLISVSQLCRSLVHSNSKLKALLNCPAESMDPSLLNLLTCSQDALICYYTSFMEFQCSMFDDVIRTQNLREYHENILCWEEISTEEGTDDGKLITSTIKVPSQMSLHLHRLLMSAVQGVNETSGHATAHRVIHHIWHTMAKHIHETYNAYQRSADGSQLFEFFEAEHCTAMQF
ncbi:Conserved oligomeric Golgi complex subunit 1 [Halotydeus destructor]|nr:Conserved oligomeric Golgi complex subunit 1 [Halotydeus destructor]